MTDAKRMSSGIVLIFVALLAGATVPRAQSNAVVGYVAGLDGAGRLVRGAEVARPIRLGELIRADDLVSAEPPSSVRIDTRSERIVVCGPGAKAEACARRFQATGRLLPAGEWWSRVVSVIGWYSTPARNLVTRSASPPRLLYGNGRAQKLEAGRRDLVLSWENGQPPYVVRVLQAAQPIAEATVGERRAVLAAIALPEGPASIEITDASERRATLPIVGVGRLPETPDMEAAAVNAEHRALLVATWLGGAEGGSWSLEAVQRLTRITGELPAAKAVHDALVAGEVFSEP